MDTIVEYASNVIDISTAILVHRQGLGKEDFVGHVETIHRRSVEFIEDYMTKRSLPVRDLRSYLNHDAKSPVTIVIGYSEFMMMVGKNEIPPAYLEALQEIADYGYAIQEELEYFHDQVWTFMQEMGIPR